MKKSLFLLSSLLVLPLFGCQLNSGNNNNNNNPSSIEVSYDVVTYMNPLSVTLNGNDYTPEIADPSIVDGQNGYYYIVSTDRRMLRSEDLVSWEVISEAYIDVPTWGEGLYENPGPKYVWAPDLMKIGDTWVLYYSMSGTEQPYGVGIATSKDVEGPYVDQGKLFDYKEIGIDNAIDPQQFLDSDGSLYLVCGSYQGVYLLELNEDGQSLVNGVAYQKEHKTLIAGKPGEWDSNTYEGGYIIKKDNKYYFFGSKGYAVDKEKSNYEVYCGVSDSVYGPYRDHNGIDLTYSGGFKTYGRLVLTGFTTPEKEVAGPGHNSIFKDDAGDYWIYYHAYYTDDNYATRHLFMDKLLWDNKGFPYVEKCKPSYFEELDGPRIISK